VRKANERYENKLKYEIILILNKNNEKKMRKMRKK
jgi:hypothetical protein